MILIPYGNLQVTRAVLHRNKYLALKVSELSRLYWRFYNRCHGVSKIA